MTLKTLQERAQNIILENLCLLEEETLLVVVDDPSFKVGELFYVAAKALKRRTQLICMAELSHAGEEPSSSIAAAMRSADVTLCITVKSITHTNARIGASASGTRVVTMPAFTMEMLQAGASCADYTQVEARTSRLTERLSAAKCARIEKDGHVLYLDLEGRSGVASPGVYREPGASGNFPSGEAYIAPIENKSLGTMVIDGSMVGIGKLKKPLVVTIEQGHLTHLEGDDLDTLAILRARPENNIVAELGIGTNEKAILSGIILEDEKLYGSVHIAFGTNTSFGGLNKADCHYDGVILKPTLYLDDDLIIKDGVFITS